MKRLKILFTERFNGDKVGASLTQHEFEQTVGKYATCKYAGKGFPDYREGETLDETVQRIMPDADWVIDRDNNFTAPKESERTYNIGTFISDLHAKHSYGLDTPMKWAKMLKDSDYDAYFMRYPLVYGTSYRAEVMLDSLGERAVWVPWSVNLESFHPREEKKYDVAFLGSTYDCYPLRKSIVQGIFYAGRGYKILMKSAPPGMQSMSPYSELHHRYVVGNDYAEALGSTRIMIFDCSYYLYAILKFFEASASGCLIMCNEPSMGRWLGFIPRETMIDIREDSWEEALKYYLKHKEEAQAIASKCMKNTRKYHGHDTRAQYFVKKLKEMMK